MSFIKTASVILSAISTTVVMSALGANKANALSEVSLPSTIMIKSAHSNLVVDKYGDNPSFADKAHLYSQANPATFTLRPVRSANGSYETQLASRTNLCFTAAGGLNPNMGNGTQAVFSGDCANSLNLRFYDDGTVRIGRNTGMCLTNQGNRYNTLLNKLHFWACDGSPETKWNFVGVGNPGSYTPPAPVVQQYKAPVQVVKNPNTYTKPIVKQPAIKYQSAGFNGLDVFDLNPLSPEFSSLNLGNGQRVKVNVSAPGTPGSAVFHTYTYFNNSQGLDLIYAVKKFKNASNTASKVGTFGGFAAKFLKALKAGGFIGGTSIVAGLYYDHMTTNTIDDAEYCLNKGKGFWIDAKGGILFLDQQLKCDK
jgi:hypothetical protein